MPIPHLKPKKQGRRRYPPHTSRASSPIKKDRRRKKHTGDVWRDTWHKRSTIHKATHSQPPVSSIKKRVISGILVLFGIGALVGGGAFLWYAGSLPSPDEIANRPLPLSTKIYDRTGKEVLYEVHGSEKRSRVSLDQIPDFLKWATLAAEDRNFYRHKGIRFASIIRAVFVNVIQGEKAQGASTITQQFIKNAVLSPEKKYSRKIKEMILSWKLEQSFSKDEILEMYFNEIPYGSVAYGAASAADIYFGKNLNELTLAESAILAALPKAPTFYSPYGPNKDKLKIRQEYILDAMAEEGYISKEKAERAKEEKLEFQPPKGNIRAPHFVMYVRQYLAQKYGDQLIEQGGLSVVTTLDLFKQERAEKAIQEWGERNEQDHKAKNAALVSIDPKTGEILAMVGSRDYFNDENEGKVNVALRPRQPGSSFKPIVYAAAFEQGLSPDTILFDVETVFKTDTEDYIPKNYDGEERGPVSIKKALAGSLNIPAVKTLYLVGIDSVLSLSERMGYTTLSDRSRFGLSLVLGGGEVTLLEHTAAYGAFARDGIYYPPVSVLKVTDNQGNVLEEYTPKEGKQVLDSTAVRYLNSILTDNEARAYMFGENNYLTLGSRPVAAKTGTTNDNRDTWTLGYTPSLVTGVWVGNNDFSKMGSRAVGASTAAPIWNTYMKQVLGDTPVETFKPPPDTPLPNKPMLNGKVGDEVVVKIDRATNKLATELTPPSFIIEKTFQTIHTILYYVKPGDILGPPPEDPTKDPNYQTWEEAVQRWAKENGIETQESPPTEYDNVHTIENKPSISIISPSDNFTLLSPFLDIKVRASAPRGVERVQYLINGTPIGVSRTPPFGLRYTIKRLPNGKHTLTARAFDDVDNSNEYSIDFNLSLPQELVPFTVTWKSPSPGNTFFQENFPIPLSLEVDKPNLVKKVDFYAQKEGTPFSTWIGYKNSPIGNTVSILWESVPPQGSYILSAVFTDTEGEIVRSQEMRIFVK